MSGSTGPSASPSGPATTEPDLGRVVADPPGWLRALGMIVVVAGLALVILIGIAIALVAAADDERMTALVLVPMLASIAYLLVYAIFGVRIIGQQEFVVVERLGQYLRILRNGIRIVVPGLDKEKSRGNLLYSSYSIYSKDSPAEIDFKDASAPVVAAASVRIGNPNLDADNPRINEDILDWTYRFDTPRKRIEEIIDGAIRPILQAFTIDDASTKKEEISGDVCVEVRKALPGTGAYLNPRKGIIIEDIRIPDSIKLQRERVLAGAKAAAATVAENEGVVGAIEAIMKGFMGSDGKSTITFQEAAEIWKTQVANETLRKTGSNVTIMAKDLDSIIRTLEVGGKK